MAKDKGKSPRKEEIRNVISRKLDNSMRRLLKKSEAEIRKEYNKDKRRLTRERKKIEEATVMKLPITASDSDRKAMTQTFRNRLTELMPCRDLISIIPDKLKPVRIRAIVRFTGNRDDLEDMGIEVRSQAQDVFTIVGTKKQLNDLVLKPSCRRFARRGFFHQP